MPPRDGGPVAVSHPDRFGKTVCPLGLGLTLLSLALLRGLARQRASPPLELWIAPAVLFFAVLVPLIPGEI